MIGFEHLLGFIHVVELTLETRFDGSFLHSVVKRLNFSVATFNDLADKA